ncbi:C-type lectin domain family 12 member A [Phyllostomus discolor]|uniref:C-type lectin domain family 12 member A n=1 Tax=Phyllostomus discolor TaxID=89673 RepID=A0A6J2NFL9_9CHIR|nr:C-type lectin domain family 12 member A isoform X1 [Phyllostomus discolor]KAF6118025.1 C-type lectin domain family 12 member A [Phyllostomus discolor]
MSEEVTYADLKFQDSSKIEHVQKFDQVGIKAPSAPSHGLHKRDLALILLCLLLMTGLGILGSMFHLTSKREMEKLKKLQNFKEELQKNVSLQLMYNMDICKKIRNISTTLQELATKLCYELYRREPEHKCKPCPKEWMWHEDSCYKLFKNYDTWQNSGKTCSAHNASLLKIRNKSVLEFIKSQELYNYWLGLSPRKVYTKYKNLDETLISSNWFTRNTSDLSDGKYCGFITNIEYVFYDYCTSRKYSVCEKLADPVKIESTLMNEEPDERM